MDVEVEPDTNTFSRSPEREELSRPEPPRSSFPRLSRRRNSPLDVFATRESGEYCTYRFLSKKAHLAYQAGFGNTSKVNVERQFPMDGIPAVLRAVFNRNNIKLWNNLITREGASSELVKEIMSNMKYHDTEEGREIDDIRVVYCRRRWLMISPRVIGEILHIAPLTDIQCGFEMFLSRPRDEARAEVESWAFLPDVVPAWSGHGDFRTWRCPPRQLKRDARWLAEIVYSWIWCLTPPTSVTFETLALAWCLWSGYRVDIPKRIYLDIVSRITDTGSPRAVGHAYLLLAIARKYQVPISPAEFDLIPREKTGPRKYGKIPPVSDSEDDEPARGGQGASTQAQRETGPSEIAQSVPGPSQHQSGESDLAHAIRLLTEQVTTLGGQVASFGGQLGTLSAQVAANHEEAMFRSECMREGVNQVGLQTQRIGQWAGEWAVHRGYKWYSTDDPGDWIYQPVTFDRPPVHAQDKGKGVAGPSTHVEETEEYDSDETD